MAKRKRLISRETEQKLLLNLGIPLAFFLYKVSQLTWRVTHHGIENRSVKPGIFCTLHCDLLVGAMELPKMNPGVDIMVSQSRDGEIIARFVELMGMNTIRGSSSKGAESATRALKTSLDKNHAVVIPVDGPRGPAGIVKPGAIALAALTGAPIICAVVIPKKSWRAKSWDRMLISKPFTKIDVYYSEPIYVPRDLTKEQREEKRLELEELLVKMKTGCCG